MDAFLSALCWVDSVTFAHPSSLRSLLEPIRKIAARVRGHFLEARALEVDIENKMIEVQSVNGRQDRFYVPYDKLVVAVGATSITHGIEGIEHTMRLKTIQDAQQIRRKVLTNVELACLPTTTPEERKKLLSFVICGGGATGTEFAAGKSKRKKKCGYHGVKG